MEQRSQKLRAKFDKLCNHLQTLAIGEQIVGERDTYCQVYLTNIIKAICSPIIY